jgi:hypothetical protein
MGCEIALMVPTEGSRSQFKGLRPRAQTYVHALSILMLLRPGCEAVKNAVSVYLRPKTYIRCNNLVTTIRRGRRVADGWRPNALDGSGLGGNFYQGACFRLDVILITTWPPVRLGPGRPKKQRGSECHYGQSARFGHRRKVIAQIRRRINRILSTCLILRLTWVVRCRIISAGPCKLPAGPQLHIFGVPINLAIAAVVG